MLDTYIYFLYQSKEATARRFVMDVDKTINNPLHYIPNHFEGKLEDSRQYQIIRKSNY